MNGPQIAWLAAGKRLHLNHGPIDLVIEAFGREAECRAAYDAAIGRFGTILEELVAELPELRRPVGAERSQGIRPRIHWRAAKGAADASTAAAFTTPGDPVGRTQLGRRPRGL